MMTEENESGEDFVRKQRGKLIATHRKIEKVSFGWRVARERYKGSYLVRDDNGTFKCECRYFELKQRTCKHIYAIQYYRAARPDDGDIPDYPRKTHGQNWSAYNKAQTEEKDSLMRTLADMCEQVKEPPYKFGRPRINIRNMVFSVIYKVYSGLSARRCMCDLKLAHERKYITQLPSYNTLLRYFADKTIIELVQQLIPLSASPLRNIETSFSIDSTGFGTTIKQNWFDNKHGKAFSFAPFLKAHLVSGNKTNVVPAAKVTREFSGDIRELKPLIEMTKQVFVVKELLADKAYSSRKTTKWLHEQEIRPYIPYKKNSDPRGRGKFWEGDWNFFMREREEFLRHYTKRNNAESTISAIKRRLGERLRNKKDCTQTTELYSKIIAHNVIIVNRLAEWINAPSEVNFIYKRPEEQGTA